jgi:uncharacterized membrane protein
MFLLSAWLIAVLAVVATTAGLALPSDVRLPMHWNAAGAVDRWGGKWPALLFPVGFAGIVTIIFASVARFEPYREAMARSEGLIRVVWFGMIGLAWVIELMVLAVAFHWQVAPVQMLLIGMGLLFVAMGNQFGKSRPMRFVGIRTPWTLASPDVWIATHRLGGKLFVLAGLVWCAAGLLGIHGPHAMRALTAILLLAALVPAIWSYVFWRRISGSNAS